MSKMKIEFNNSISDKETVNYLNKAIEDNNYKYITFYTTDHYKFTIDEHYIKEWSFIDSINKSNFYTSLLNFMFFYILICCIFSRSLVEAVSNYFDLSLEPNTIKLIMGLIITLSNTIFNNFLYNLQEYIFSKFSFSEHNSQHKQFIQNRNVLIKLTGNIFSLTLITTYLTSFFTDNTFIYFCGFIFILLICIPTYIYYKKQIIRYKFNEHIPFNPYNLKSIKSIEFDVKEE